MELSRASTNPVTHVERPPTQQGSEQSTGRWSASIRTTRGWRIAGIPLPAVRTALAHVCSSLRDRWVQILPDRPRTGPSALAPTNFETQNPAPAPKNLQEVTIHQRDYKATAPSQVTVVLDDGIGPLKSQHDIARELGLPTSFAQVRGEQPAQSRQWQRTEFPLANSDFFQACTTAQLDAFTEYSNQHMSAENMYLLMALEKLMKLPAGSDARKALAEGMQKAFTGRSAELSINLASRHSTKFAAALATIVEGDTPADLERTVAAVRNNLLQSVGADSYKRYLETLSA